MGTPLIDATAAWLLTGYTSEPSRTNADNALGVPRVDQCWRGEPTPAAAAAPNPPTLLPQCQRAGIDPLTDCPPPTPQPQQNSS